jgi:hypothetical protein
MDLSDRVTEAVKNRVHANYPVWKLIDEIKKDNTLKREERVKHLAQLYGVLSDKDVLERTANDVLEYSVGTSFRSNITDLRRTKHKMKSLGTNIFPGGNPKLKDREFASKLGVSVPQTYQKNVPLHDIVLRPKSIIKPVSGAGSSGVFFIDESLRFHSMKTSHIHETLQDAQTEIRRFRKKSAPDKWISEEAILTLDNKPASDMKVYSFYGAVGLVLEIDRATRSSNALAAYTASGKQIELGPKYRSFSGSGLPEGIMELSEKMSLAAPVPFLRLDFHNGAKGPYLGEITPHPGGTYSGDLNDDVDKMLGELFADAKARLYIDLLNGKTFPEFRQVYDV